MDDGPGLDRIQILYDEGRLLDAYALALARGPLGSWRGPDGRVLAGRLTRTLGGPRRGRAMHLRAHKEHPDHPNVRYYHARAYLELQGPLPTWRLLERLGDARSGDPSVDSDFASLRAEVLGQLRDFDAAERWIARAEEIEPGNPWTSIIRSEVLEAEDRYLEALEAARRSLEIRPWFRPGVQVVAHLLEVMGRPEESLAVLREASAQVQSGDVLVQLANLEHELGLYAAARSTLDRVGERWPMADRELAEWLVGRRSDAAYHCGDLAEAARLAGEAQDDFHRKIHAALTSSNEPLPRKLLDLEFVRQHHLTCGPATLTAISRYWAMPADHLEVAEAICYDGTSATGERRWAVEHGWVAREFRVTWESAKALIDRGVPFTLTTVETSSSHLQAVVGYDQLRGTLLVRDPFVPQLREFVATVALERYRPVGPRGMAMVPAGRADLLDGLDLPDADLYDLHHDLELALLRHDRPAAKSLLERMAVLAPDARLTIEARCSVASYDADAPSELECLERLVAMFPSSDHWHLQRSYRLLAVGRRKGLIEALRSRVECSAGDPIVLEQYGQALGEDARRLPEALKLIRRSIRILRQKASGYYILASLLWRGRQFEDAMEAYRFATCLDDKDERIAAAFFAASRHFRRTDDAIQFLTRRFERFIGKSSGPARTLFHALSSLDRAPEAFERLQQALLMRPTDGDLILFAADLYARYGRQHEAAKLLESARGKCSEGVWLRVSAQIRMYRGEPRESLGLWKRVLELEPLAVDAHGNVAARLEEVEGREVALAHLERAVHEFPHHRGLQELLIQWLRDGDLSRLEAAVRRLLEDEPDNAWARRELALVLARQRSLDEALREVEQAGRVDPHSPSYPNVRGTVLKLAGRHEEACEAFRGAILLDIDDSFAIGELVALAPTPQARREALEFVRTELVRRVTFGDGLLAYAEHAADSLEAEELVATLREALEIRPDLWQSWAALTRHLVATGCLDEAHSIAVRATERFPLVPILWMELAQVCRVRLDRQGEVAALEKARAVQPAWSAPARALVDVYNREGRFDECRVLMEQAVAREPLDAVNHGYLAESLWRAGEREAAIRAVERAVELEPGYHWAWDKLRDWSRELGRPDPTVAKARELAEKRPGESRAWLLLARTLGRERAAEALEALDRAVRLEPRDVGAHDLRAELLAETRRYEEALLACAPAVYGGDIPIPLRGRAAWVEARRGRLDRAVELMQAAVEIDDSYSWGWSQLADWCSSLGDQEAQARAVTALARLHPNHPGVLGDLGDLSLRKGDRPTARSCFSRAVGLSPEDNALFLKLFLLHIEDGEARLAEELLRTCEPHLSPSRSRACEILVRNVRGCAEEIPAVLDALLAMPDLETSTLEVLVERLGGDGKRALDAAIERAGRAPEAGPVVAEFLVRRLAGAGRWSEAHAVVRRLPSGSKAFAAAARGFLHECGVRGSLRVLRGFVRLRRPELHGDPILWGSTAYAWCSLGAHRECVRWMAGWEGRSGTEPWMLENLAHSLRWLGRDADSAEVSRRALELPADHSASLHEAWLLVDELLRGDLSVAAERESRIEPQSLSEIHRVAMGLSRSLLIVLREPSSAEARCRAWAELDRAMRSEPALRRDRLRRRLARRTILRLAVLAGGPGSWLRALVRLASL